MFKAQNGRFFSCVVFFFFLICCKMNKKKLKNKRKNYGILETIMLIRVIDNLNFVGTIKILRGLEKKAFSILSSPASPFFFSRFAHLRRSEESSFFFSSLID